jgi:hypothetical protein
MANIVYGGLTTTAVTANQVIATGTPTVNAKLKCIVIAGFLTTWSATEANLGTVYIRQASTAKGEWRIQNTDNDTLAGIIVVPLGDGVSFTGSEVVDVTVTPASTTSMRWTASLFYDIA